MASPYELRSLYGIASVTSPPEGHPVLPWRHQFVNSLQDYDAPPGWDCSICHLGPNADAGANAVVEVHENPVRIPACGHTFHQGCLYAWLESGQAGARTRCPMCRASLFQERVQQSPPQTQTHMQHDNDIDDPRHWIHDSISRALNAELYTAAWTNPQAFARLEAAVRTALTKASSAETQHNWVAATFEIADTFTDSATRMILPYAARRDDGEVRVWASAGHARAGAAWVELFVMERIVRRAVVRGWWWAGEMREFRERHWETMLEVLDPEVEVEDTDGLDRVLLGREERREDEMEMEMEGEEDESDGRDVDSDSDSDSTTNYSTNCPCIPQDLRTPFVPTEPGCGPTVARRQQ